MAVSPIKFELTDEPPIDDAALGKIIGQTPAEVRAVRQRGNGVIQVCAGAYQANNAGKWCWWSDKEWEDEE